MPSLFRSQLLLFICFLALMVSCKKEDTPKTAAELLAKSWRVQQVLIDKSVDAGSYTNYQLTFKADGTYTLVDRYKSPSVGTWVLSQNQQQLTFDKGMPNAITADVLTLSVSALTLYYSVESNKTGQHTNEYRLIPQ